MVKTSSGDRSPLLLKALAGVAEAARAFSKLTMARIASAFVNLAYANPRMAYRASAISKPLAKLCVVRLICICCFDYRTIVSVK